MVSNPAHHAPSHSALTLWLLWRRDDSRYDGFNGFVVRAADEDDARRFADTFGSRGPRGIWTDPALAGCREVRQDGQRGLVLAAGDLADTSRMIGR